MLAQLLMASRLVHHSSQNRTRFATCTLAALLSNRQMSHGSHGLRKQRNLEIHESDETEDSKPSAFRPRVLKPRRLRQLRLGVALVEVADRRLRPSNCRFIAKIPLMSGRVQRLADRCAAEFVTRCKTFYTEKAATRADFKERSRGCSLTPAEFHATGKLQRIRPSTPMMRGHSFRKGRK
jgi:hypothetical protein